MRNTPDFYIQKDKSIIAYSQDVEPKGRLIFGYDYNKQRWVTKGKEKIREYLKRGLTIKVIKSELPQDADAIIEYQK